MPEEGFGDRSKIWKERQERLKQEETFLRGLLQDFEKVLAFSGSPKEAIAEPRVVDGKLTNSGEIFAAYLGALGVVGNDRFPSVSLERKQSLIDRIAESGDPHLSMLALSHPAEYTKYGTRNILVDNVVAGGDPHFALLVYRG